MKSSPGVSTPDPWCTVADAAAGKPGSITAHYYPQNSKYRGKTIQKNDNRIILDAFVFC